MAIPAHTALPVLRGICYDGRSSRAVRVSAELRPDGTLKIIGPGLDQSAAWHECRVSEPLGQMPRFIEVPGGGKIETDELALLALWEQATGRGRANRTIHLLESRKRWMFAAFIILAAAVFAAWRWGIPAAAKAIATRTPPSVERAVTEQSRRALEFFLGLDATNLPAERQGSLSAEFRKIAAAMDPAVAHNYRLEFYQSKALGANALALPDGLVLVTDGLVKKAGSDAEILAVLAHEVTHVRERHGLRLALQDSTLFLLWSLVTGDLVSITTVGSALPALLAQRGYSRAFEKEADLGAARYLHSAGGDTRPLRDMLRRIDPENVKDAGRSPENTAQQGSDMLSTHPLTEERIRLLEEYDRAEGGKR